MDEFARIREIRRRLGEHWGGVQIGIGDDAAVLQPSARPTVLSVDTAVEGVHFEWSFAQAKTLARRAAIAALSDLSAMGATPTAMLCAWSLPPSLDEATLFALADGFAAAARECDAPVVGGNLSAGPVTSMTTTVVGVLEAAALTRSGARIGDGIFVTGPLGGAALGLHQLLALDAEARLQADGEFIDRWRRPQARIACGKRVAAVASAGIDLSDGLIQDLGHVCEASGVGARVQAEGVPTSPALQRAARDSGLSAMQLALTGGEDFELLYTGAQPAREGDVRVGEITAELGVVAVDSRGHPVEIDAGGFDHFGHGDHHDEANLLGSHGPRRTRHRGDR